MINDMLSFTCPEKEQSLEAFALLRKQFDTMFALCRDFAVHMATEFSDYEEVLYNAR
jgi:hypothetical protein